MCGIAGYVGYKNASDFVVDALEKLSYRGYDSSGISVFSEKEKLLTKKAAGKISVLKEKLKDSPLPPSYAAIGHTRWATHGAVTDKNSHPHSTENVTLVHNGIIENHRLIKQKLLALGYTFTSETDTEAAVLLLDYYYKKSGEPLSAIKKCTAKLQGSFAFAVMFADIPDTVFAVRHESPLLIGLGDGEFFVASDIPAFLAHTRKYFRLGELEIAKITRSSVTLYTRQLEEIGYTAEYATFDETGAEKNGFMHFMRKEIEEEPSIVSRILKLYTDEDGLPHFDICKQKLKNARKLLIVGCGTAYHAGLYLKFLLRTLAGMDADCEVASEFRYSDAIIDERCIALFISQSGETADTLSSLRLAKAKGAYTVGIVNVRGSAIANEADCVFYTQAGVEISVASTKAYTAQCTIALLFAVYTAALTGKISSDQAREFMLEAEKLPELIRSAIAAEEITKEAAGEISKSDDVFFIGRQADYLSALEGSLKLKEISYVHSECYPAGELKHGTISLIEENTPVIAVISDLKMKEKTLSNIKEVATRGAKTIVLSPLDEDVAAACDTLIGIPKSSPFLSPVFVATTLQLLAYHAANLRGCDVDQPRNLAKSVTVE